MSKIKNYKELNKKLDKIRESIVPCPFHASMRVTVEGCFESEDYMFLQPHEAQRLGKFLVDFYGTEEE